MRRFKSLCFPRTHLTKEFDERLATRGSKGRVFGWTDPVVVYSQDIPCAPASSTNTATRKGWTSNSNELKSVLGLAGVNFNSGRFRLQFVNTAARNSFLDVVSEIEVDGYKYDLSGFFTQSTKNLETRTKEVRDAAYADIEICRLKVYLK